MNTCFLLLLSELRAFPFLCLISVPLAAEITEDMDSSISAFACVKSTALSEVGEMVREEFSAATTRGI